MSTAGTAVNAHNNSQTETAQDAGATGSTGKPLVIVSGPGRSGTSAITGSLSALGVHVPGPLVEANRSNPRGFFETRWVVEFHKRLLTSAHAYEFDPDPAAVARVQTVLDARIRAELERWLAEESGHEQASQLAIKDPRTVWVHDLWGQVAADRGLDTRYLTTLRHPAEVAGSREKYYGRNADRARARAYAINKVAGWINVSLLNERQTRSNRRVFVRYTDLITDWRPVLDRVQDTLGLSFDQPEPGSAHPVDEFITPGLRHVQADWDEIEAPRDLRELAEATWAASNRLVDDPDDRALDAEFDQLGEAYDDLFSAAAAITSDLRVTAVDIALDKAGREAVKRQAAAVRAAVEPFRRRPAAMLGQAVRQPGRAARSVRRRLTRSR